MSRIGRGRYENDNRKIIDDTKVIISNPAVTADIKTNSGNVCEYWDASCHVQQGVDSIVENVIQAGENITSWGDSTTKWIQGGFVEAGENIQDAYVENIETPIVEAYEETIKFGEDAAKNAQDAFDATVKAAEDAAAATAKAASDAAAAAGEGVTSGINDTLKYGALAALGIVGVLLVSKK